MGCGRCNKKSKILEEYEKEARNIPEISFEDFMKTKTAKKKVIEKKSLSWIEKVKRTIERIEKSDEDEDTKRKKIKAVMAHNESDGSAAVVNLGTDEKPIFKGIFIN